MKTMTRITRAEKTGVLMAAVVGVAGFASADRITTSIPNGSFEETALSPNASQVSIPSSWSFASGDTENPTSCWMGNLDVDGTPITPHDADQVVYFKPNQFKTDRIQNSPSVILTSDKFAAGETTGTLQVSAWYQRWGTGTAGAYIHVFLNGVKAEPTIEAVADPTPETDWQQLLWDVPGITVSVGDTLAVILWGYTFGTSGEKQIIWDDITYTIISGPDLPVDITQIQVDDVIGMQFDSFTGTNYRLQFTTDMNSGIWVNADYLMFGTGQEMTAFDPSGFSTQKSYRVVALP
jgi:hypothetical protein